MNNINSLFENLMMYNEISSKKTQANLKESDQTILNLAVELPDEIADIKPDDVTVEVGVMEIDADDTEKEEKDTEIDSTDGTDVDDELELTADSDESKEDDTDDKKTEESIAPNFDDAKARILKRAKVESDDKSEKTEGLFDINMFKKARKVSECKKIDKETDKEEECIEKPELKENLAKLEINSLNKLITDFVRENYKNIDKIRFNKAILENNKLILKGSIYDMNGKKEAITFVNRGFNINKLENKSFLIDFKDASKTFGIIKEGLKQPFVFKANMKNGTVTFESLKVNFKTKITESKSTQVTGRYILKED